MNLLIQRWKLVRPGREIKKKSAPATESLVFVDESGLTKRPATGRLGSAQGQTQVLLQLFVNWKASRPWLASRL